MSYTKNVRVAVPEIVHHEAYVDEETETLHEAYDETVYHYPVMNVPMTEEEITQMLAEQASMPEPEPTIEEQLSDLSEYVDILSDFLMGGDE